MTEIVVFEAPARIEPSAEDRAGDRLPPLRSRAAAVLGGVEIPHTQGFDGHSDADVLAHAIIDAILGAASMGDIGTHFPDTDPEWKDADSIELLREIVRRVARRAGASSMSTRP